MIPGVALAQWLSDRGAQQTSQDKVDAAAREWSVAPLIARLDRDVVEADPRTAASLIAAARRFLDRTEDVEAMMRDLIARSRDDAFFRPPFHPLASEVQNSLLLYHHPKLIWGLVPIMLYWVSRIWMKTYPGYNLRTFVDFFPPLTSETTSVGSRTSKIESSSSSAFLNFSM